MLRHKIIVLLLFLGFLFFFGFLATYSKIKKDTPDLLTEEQIIPIQENPVLIVNDPILVTNNTRPTSLFNTVVTLSLNSQVVFSDGLTVTLKEINDSRCPKDVQCVWAGELSGVLVLSGDNTSATQEIRLSTVVNKTVNVGQYTFTIKDATVASLDFSVSKQ